MAVSRGKQIAQNTILLYLRMFVGMGISLYTSRVILRVLGFEDFGIYNIVGSIVVLFSFFSNSLVAAIQRYLSFSLGQEDLKRFNQIFSQGFWSMALLALGILFLSETVGLYIFYHFIDIPAGRYAAAFWVYQFSIASFIVNILRTPYNAALIAYERMSFYAYISILEVVLKLAVVFCITAIPLDKLVVYASLILAVAIVSLLIYVWYCLKYMEGCRLVRKLDVGVMMELTRFSGWTLLGKGAQAITYQGNNILLNNFFGVIVNAATGVTSQITNAYTTFLGNFQVAFNPQLVKSYASGDYAYFRSLLYRTAIASFYLMQLVSVPVIVKMDYILSLWLDAVPGHTGEFSICIILSLLIESYTGPLWMAVQATGNIRKYQIIISLSYLLDFCGGLLFLCLGYPPVSVFVVKVCVAVLVLFVRTFLLNQMVDISLARFLVRVVLRSFVIFLVVLAAAFYIGSLVDGFEGLCLVLLFSTVFSLLMIYMFGLDKPDKEIIRKVIQNRIKIKKDGK